MQCNILKNLYVKSNGDIRCDDDFGERVLLGKVAETGRFSPTALFNNEHFSTIRENHAGNRPPWGQTCERCVFYRSGKVEDSIARKRIHKVQLEPTLLCSLRCPACSREAQIKAGRKPLILSVERLETLLKGLVEEKYRVEVFELCGQGEPLNHPAPDTLIQLINAYYPNAEVSVITNGNFALRKKLGKGRVSEIVVAADGAYQNSYEQYRVNGNINQCVRFMEDARRYLPEAKVVWKYVLFNHNDSDREVINAQAIANRLSLHELRFINTTYGPASGRLTEPHAPPFPLISEQVRVHTHPLIPDTFKVLNVEVRSRNWRKYLTQKLGPKFERKFSPSSRHRIERVSLVKKKQQFYVFIDGWSLATKPVLLTCLSDTKEAQRTFTNNHMSLWQSVRKLFRRKVTLRAKQSGFRESFTLRDEILPASFDVTVKRQGRLFPATFRYRCYL